jgi:hypothetical protein
MWTSLFCTSKASKLSTCIRRNRLGKVLRVHVRAVPLSYTKNQYLAPPCRKDTKYQYIAPPYRANTSRESILTARALGSCPLVLGICTVNVVCTVQAPLWHLRQLSACDMYDRYAPVAGRRSGWCPSGGGASQVCPSGGGALLSLPTQCCSFSALRNEAAVLLWMGGTVAQTYMLLFASPIISSSTERTTLTLTWST